VDSNRLFNGHWDGIGFTDSFKHPHGHFGGDLHGNPNRHFDRYRFLDPSLHGYIDIHRDINPYAQFFPYGNADVYAVQYRFEDPDRLIYANRDGFAFVHHDHHLHGQLQPHAFGHADFEPNGNLAANQQPDGFDDAQRDSLAHIDRYAIKHHFVDPHRLFNGHCDGIPDPQPHPNENRQPYRYVDFDLHVNKNPHLFFHGNFHLNGFTDADDDAGIHLE
jgi:hypothetical protein